MHKKPKLQPPSPEQLEQAFADWYEWHHRFGALCRLTIMERVIGEGLHNPQSRIWRLNRAKSNYIFGATG